MRWRRSSALAARARGRARRTDVTRRALRRAGDLRALPGRATRSPGQVVAESAHRIALHVAPIAAVTDVALVVLGGGIGANGDLLLEPVRGLLARRGCPTRPASRCRASATAAVLTGASSVGLRAALDRVFVKPAERRGGLCRLRNDPSTSDAPARTGPHAETMERLVVPIAVVGIVGGPRAPLGRSAAPAGSALVASPTRTPGVVNPDVRQETIGETICVPAGRARSGRRPSYTVGAEGRARCASTASAAAPSDYQEDHLISLELGGHPTDPRNLWPEPRPHAEEVDRIENELNRKVCSGEITLAEGQRREIGAQALVRADEMIGVCSS